MKTYSAKPESVKRDWYVVDASGKTLGRLAAVAADSATLLYNLLLDGDHSYWVVQSGAAALMQTISATAETEGGAGQAYLVHNKGG